LIQSSHGVGMQVIVTEKDIRQRDSCG
jgi:hypothetical protein